MRGLMIKPKRNIQIDKPPHRGCQFWDNAPKESIKRGLR